MVILAGDDPGSYGSQNEQDSRLLGAFAEIPILEPATPKQGYRMTRQAFRLSEACRLPVMVRFVADYTVDRAPVTMEPHALATRAEFSRERRWSALPALVVDDHAALHKKLKQIAGSFDHPPYRTFNRSDHSGSKGIIAAGHMAARLRHYEPHSDLSVFELGIRQALQEVFSRKGLSFLVVRGRCPFIETRKCQATGVSDSGNFGVKKTGSDLKY